MAPVQFGAGDPIAASAKIKKKIGGENAAAKNRVARHQRRRAGEIVVQPKATEGHEMPNERTKRIKKKDWR